jgi:2-polyprenyl-6-methoxyphenol hydroxylase-like FAD-dependent oxidoreductase
LLEELPAGVVRTGAEVRDPSEVDADLVVAADGVHSGLRRQLFPAAPEPDVPARSKGRANVSTAWRMPVLLPAKPVAGGR